MSRFHSYLNTAVAILKQYDGAMPFAANLKQFFAANKKMGATDRRQISDLCYSFFRLGKAGLHLSVDERILAGKFCCTTDDDALLQAVKPEWNSIISDNIVDKLKLLGLDVHEIFPFKDVLSDGIDGELFSLSFLQQPHLFIRIRPGNEEVVKRKLLHAGVNFKELSPLCLSLPNATKLDRIIQLNREAVIQDYSSQRVGALLEKLIPRKIKNVWDCCAASGGKSILAKDVLGNINLTVNDVRETILYNLKKRFAEAGIKSYNTIITDLSQRGIEQNDQFDLIIADVPCSGSGTWARTPEQLYYFDKHCIEKYVQLQKSILTNIVSSLKPGGYLLYITCSVFKDENENNVQFLTKNFSLQLNEQIILKGYDMQADTMFAALLSKPYG